MTSATLNREELIRFFHAGGKPASRHRIGIEYETLGILPQGNPLPYFGSPGVQEILKNISLKYNWKEVYENNNLIALSRHHSTVTLEPGGQVEFSSSPWSTLAELEKEFQTFLRELNEVSEPLGVRWLALGIHPNATLESIPWVPKGRYEIMSRYLGKQGALSHRMMKQTASVQVNLDYTNEKEAIEKFRLLMGLAPIFTALFANSSVLEGKDTGFVSYRAHVWQATDPGRCGLIKEVFDPAYSFEEYLDWALAVPMLFIQREGKWISVEKLTFGQYLEKGFGPHRATMEDWELHLSTLFPEVRLKQFLELRSVDSQLPEKALSVAALALGLLYDAASRAAAWDFIKNWSWEERLELYRTIPKTGLRTRIKHATIISIANELIALARIALRKRGEERYLKEELWPADTATTI